MSKEIDRIYIEIVPDQTPDRSYLDQDIPGLAERKRVYERGDFGFVGIRLAADTSTEALPEGIVTHNTITSPASGRWSRTPGRTTTARSVTRSGAT